MFSMAQLQNFALTGNPITENVTTSGVVIREIKNANNQDVATLFAESFNGVVHLQYDAILRTLYNDARTAFGGGFVFFRDNTISAIAKIDGTRYVFARGVAQHGKNPIASNKIKHTMPFLRWYDGYELGIVFNANANVNYNVTINGDEIEQDPDMGYFDAPEIVFVDLTENPYGSGKYNGVIDLVEGIGDFSILDTVNVVETPVPANPFYIRWVNNLGGFDYFMFTCNQKNKRTLTENTYFEQYESGGVQKTLSKSAKQTIEASSGMVDIETFKALSKMPLSPDIRWWDESIGEWVSVQINECNPEWMTEQPTAEFVCSFVLPNIQINK